MNNKDRVLWQAKTRKLNVDRQLKVGDAVQDLFLSKGIVVKIVVPENLDEDEGIIYVWQSEKIEYGADNCEHYHYLGWQELLRIED